MPSILKIRVIKARNLVELEEEPNGSVPDYKNAFYYSTLKLIENAELMEDSSPSVVSSSTSTSSDDDSDSHFLGNQMRLGIDRAISPANFTFRTKSVECSDGAPKWEEDFRLEVSDDAQLQDTPLQLHVYKNTSTWIGSLTVDLNPLLARDSPYGICGWFPLNTDGGGSGSRGEIFLQAKIQFFGDSNPFKESSAGVQFFCSSEIPSCIKVSKICYGTF